MSSGQHCLIRDLGLVKGGKGLRHHEVVLVLSFRGLAGFAMSKISERDAEEQMRLLTALGEAEQAMEEVRGYGLEGSADRAGPVELSGKRYV